MVQHIFQVRSCHRSAPKATALVLTTAAEADNQSKMNPYGKLGYPGLS